jgi:hypothetical protein
METATDLYSFPLVLTHPREKRVQSQKLPNYGVILVGCSTTVEIFMSMLSEISANMVEMSQRNPC